ncbi:MAG: ACP S-malonyltransferase [Clostridiales Family XIII bacterium]|jgi:[acyl-carrier-protein] S-malonyltransferase|nr:ACP S-malonyltransferase [Clostridiales Family XIII bacterium]
MTNKYKIGIVFAGQGSQYTGMGKSLYENSPAAKAILDLAGEKIINDCFYKTKEELRDTLITQPAVYTVDLAAYAALLEALGENSNAEIIALAGFSLGEYAALCAAGVIGSFDLGLEIIRKRSRLMKDAGKHADGSPRGKMAAALGNKEHALELVEQARGDDVLEAVNFNSPTQTVVAGDEEAIERFSELAAADRSLGLKVKPLSVSSAFHSPIMEPAAIGLGEALKPIKLNPPNTKVYLNVSGEELLKTIGGSFDEEKLKDIMQRQAMSPVLWQTTIENMIRDGVNTIVEVGPGKTLSGLAKKTSADLLVFHVQDKETLDEAVLSLQQ